MRKSRFFTSASITMIILIFYLQFPMLYDVSYAADPQSGPSDSKQQSLKQNNPRSPFNPGDAILINTFPDTSSFLNNFFPITDEGNVEFPVIGAVKVTDKTTKELEDFLKNQFKMYLRGPDLKVKSLIRVSVLGGIIRPGLYYVDPENSLWEVIRLAGGTTFENGIKEMRWERNRDAIIDDLVPFIQSGISLKKMGFKSGDQLWTSTIPPQTFNQSLATYLPILTFLTSIAFFYLTYQQTIYMMQIYNQGR